MPDFQVKLNPNKYDACTVGSGAGGGMAAYVLAKAVYGGKAESPMIVKLLEDALKTDLRAQGFPAKLL